MKNMNHKNEARRPEGSTLVWIGYFTEDPFPVDRREVYGWTREECVEKLSWRLAYLTQRERSRLTGAVIEARDIAEALEDIGDIDASGAERAFMDAMDAHDEIGVEDRYIAVQEALKLEEL